ncbi:4Fe-4S binding protein [Carboxylicivirga sp. A043]|uniref:nucleotide-binding protein n=1 Tax=Carboxylicivirga litoralis TaxID=2816963 RepID=UPI0021CAEB3C|nr:4Fe-4S binding protein [Carboxylicivirga sp. A043]MCU4156806.1 4Fe-4S binding protein [Carboxylicivirga sp. A043]
MHEITVLSGKGGTGKTTITGALAALAESVVICDNDVDAADLFLLLQPNIQQREPFISGNTASINTEACNQCGLCQSNCRFDAIQQTDKGYYHIDPFACEGCRLCERLCPQSAITSSKNDGNTWFMSDTRFGTFVHAQMGPGEENSGKLVSFIRKQAKETAAKNNAGYIINDGPPGIGCPVIASLSGTKQVLLVIEPTQSGWHDAERLIQLIRQFQIPVTAVINKAGLHEAMEQHIEEQLISHDIPLIAKIPYSQVFRQAMLNLQTIVEYAPDSEESQLIKKVWNTLAANKTQITN